MRPTVWSGILVASIVVVGTAGSATAVDTPGGTFFDDDGSVHEGSIEAVAERRITRGCTPAGEYVCPDRPISRAELAAFLQRALRLPPAEPGFVDVTGLHGGSIGALQAAGIARGCDPPANRRFCPDEPVTRGQAAAFFARAYGLTATGEPGFTDVEDSVFRTDIAALAGADLTRGCDPPANRRFCPDRTLSRAEAATLVARAEGLTTPAPPRAFAGRAVVSRSSGLIGPFGGIDRMAGIRRTPESLLTDSVGQAALSPDGSRVAYVDVRRACPPEATGSSDCYQRLFVTAFGGGPEVQVLVDTIRAASPAWSPDGDEIAFVESLLSGETYVSVVDVATGESRRLLGPLREASTVDWSTDGRLAVDHLTEDGRQVITIVNSEGGRLAEIGEPGEDVSSPVFAPDGETIAFGRAGVVGPASIQVSRVDGSSRRDVSRGLRPVAWSPDGSSVVHVDEEQLAVVVPVGGGSPWLLVPPAVGVADVSWVGG